MLCQVCPQDRKQATFKINQSSTESLTPPLTAQQYIQTQGPQKLKTYSYNFKINSKSNRKPLWGHKGW